jgi:hypothetical protein
MENKPQTLDDHQVGDIYVEHRFHNDNIHLFMVLIKKTAKRYAYFMYIPQEVVDNIDRPFITHKIQEQIDMMIMYPNMSHPNITKWYFNDGKFGKSLKRKSVAYVSHYYPDRPHLYQNDGYDP